MTVESLSEVKTCLLRQSSGGLLDCCSIEYFISLVIISQDLLKLVIDLLMELEQLRVCYLEDALSIFLAEHLLNLFV